MRRLPAVSVPAAVFVAALFLPAPARGGPYEYPLRELTRDDIRKRTAALPPPLAREITGMQYVLRPQELAVLLSVPAEGRCRKWIEDWWAARDPDFTTPENEARALHEDRVLSARAYFGCGQWPGWDDRGEVLIRYGLPAFSDREGATVHPPGIYIPAQELWYYPGFDMIARFVDPTGGGRFLISLEDVRLPAGERPRSDRRTMASKELADLPMDYLTVDANPTGTMYAPIPFAEKDYDDYQKAVFRYHDVVERTPAVYPFDHEAMRVPAHVAVWSFRGGDDVDRVDIATEFVPGAGRTGGDSGTYVTTEVVWDYEGHEVARRTRVDATMQAGHGDVVVGQTSLPLPPGTYHVAVTVRETGSGRFTSQKRTVDVPDLRDAPAMSDLALARTIGPARDDSPFNRGAIEVVPRPSARYVAGAPVPLYFEVYHLRGDGSGAHPYAVEYAITPVRERPRDIWRRFLGPAQAPVQVRSGFEAAATGPHDYVRVTIDTRHLKPGEFRLSVTVTDRAASRRVTREATFHLVPPPPGG